MPKKVVLQDGTEFSSIKQASVELGINYSTVIARISRGKVIDKPVATSISCRVCSKVINSSNRWRDERLCKSCGPAVKRERDLKNLPKRQASIKSWREKNKDRVLGYRENERRKRSHWKRKYGISADQVELLFASGCSVCGSFDKLVVDHCHETDIVRGCLCHFCNVSLGFARNDPEVLRGLARYIEEFSRKVTVDLRVGRSFGSVRVHETAH